MSNSQDPGRAEGCGGSFGDDPSLIGNHDRGASKHPDKPTPNESHAKEYLRAAQKQAKKKPLTVIIGGIALVSVLFAGLQWNAAENAMIAAERAWVYPYDFRFTDPNADRVIVVTMRLMNSGQSPAANVRAQAHLDLFPTGSDPGEPDWNKLDVSPPSTVFPSPENLDTKNFPAPRTGAIGRINPTRINDYTAEKLSAYIRVRITYADIFNGEHWTTACLYHVSAKDPATFIPCKTGNAFDIDPTWSQWFFGNTPFQSQPRNN